jgi:hypothetical protein
VKGLPAVNRGVISKKEKDKKAEKKKGRREKAEEKEKEGEKKDGEKKQEHQLLLDGYGLAEVMGIDGM